GRWYVRRIRGAFLGQCHGALANTVADKVEYCLQYGVEIDASDWPVKGLPDVVLADKGELNGTKVEAFSQAFEAMGYGALDAVNTPALGIGNPQ
ncbi:hypothetical protein AAIH27_35105, partial [Pseudomonas aeruginosa]